MIPMKKLRISVLIPTLDEGKYLEPTLFHIGLQKPYEIIIGDSMSTDNTAKIAKKYGAKVAMINKRGAASYGRNAAAKLAKGDVFVFIDADTIPYPNFLDVIKKDFSKGIAGWTCNFFAFSPKFRDQFLFQAASNLIGILTKYLRKPHAAGFTIAVRSDVFWKTGGFDESLRAMEDHDFAMRVGKFGKFKFSTETCVFSSVRRLDKWGRGGIIRKYAAIYLKYFVNGGKVGKIEYEPVR